MLCRTIGIYTTVADGSKFEYLQYSDVTEVQELTWRLVIDDVLSAGFKVSYACPRRRGGMNKSLAYTGH